MPYLKALENFHRFLSPKSYLEIGTASGSSLELSACSSIAIDPNFRMAVPFLGSKASCLLFQITSDDFFAQYDPKLLLKRPVDLAFLDGMHLFEFLLRDFINTERHCRHNSVVAIHDCVPVDTWMADRTYTPEHYEKSAFKNWWTGDVWKIVPLLREYRPDLRIDIYDCPPTGLVVITGLDSSSTTLSEKYFEIVRKGHEMRLDLDRLHETSDIQSSSRLGTFEEMTTLYWL